MTDYIIGCDNIDGKEKSYQSKVAKVLKEKGHNTEILSVGPNFTQTKGLSSSCKGKTAIFIVGGSDIGTYVDFRDGIKNGYYHYKYAWFAFASWTATTWITCKELKSRALVRAHDDNFSSSGSISKYIGKSADDFFKDNKDVLNYVCGQSPEELAKKILGGGSGSSDSESSGSSIKNAIQEVLYGWNGEAYCYVRDDTMHIARIPSPTSAELSLVEGDNVYQDSISVTDIDPEIPNKLIVNWGNETFVVQDEERIKRFGEISETIDATDNYEKDITSYAYREWNKLLKDSGRVLECKVDGDPKWRIGKWVRVYIPSYNLNGFMWITKCSHDDSGEWAANLTLTDYPPDLGKKPSETNTEEEEDEESEEDSDSEEEE